ncbi:MAG: TIGR04372 family glycosyltransferase [Victivallales bacterium]|nr:TIGR04372 family glycosyltransferase [Victivallales bacterium]
MKKIKGALKIILKRLSSLFGKLTLRLLLRVLSQFKVRILLIKLPTRIGHLASDPATFFKEMEVESKGFFVFLVFNGRVANEYMVQLWNQKSKVLYVSRFVWNLLISEYERKSDVILKLYYDRGLKYNILNKYTSIYPNKDILNLPKNDIIRGISVLKEMGIDEGQKYVCLHNRESGYLSSKFNYHSHRDADITNYSKTIQLLIRKGYKVIRLGDSSMTELKSLGDGLIDYPFTDWKSDFMDIFLIYYCSFMLCSTSGPVTVARLFNKQICLVNIPNPYCDIPICAGDLFIPKTIYSKTIGRYLTLREVLNLGRISRAEDYDGMGLSVIENSEDEICNITNEFIELGKTKENTLNYEVINDKLLSIFEERKLVFKSSANLGLSYLKKYPNYLD